MITPESDRAAWRDLMIRLQTRLDSADGANVGYLVDFTLTALGQAAREGGDGPLASFGEALGVGEQIGPVLAWHGLDDFFAAVLALPALRAPDAAEAARIAAGTAYRRRGLLYRAAVALRLRPDTLSQARTSAEDRVAVRDDILLRLTDAETRLVWAAFTLQILRAVGRSGDTMDPCITRLDLFVTQLDAVIPDYRFYLGDAGFAALLQEVATLPPEVLTPATRLLTRRRRIR